MPAGVCGGDGVKEPIPFKPIHSRSIMEAMLRAGIIPRECTRFVIDCSVNDVAKLYIECIGDERLLEVLTPSNVVVIKTVGGNQETKP